MERPIHRQAKNIAGGMWTIAFCGVAWLCLAVLPAQALVVTVDLGWGYNQDAGGNSLSPYNLQVGSIVQVIMYNSATASAPGIDADDNFLTWGTYSGTPIPAQPDPGGGPAPIDTTVYDPESIAAPGHVLAYTATIQEAPYLDGNGNTWWQIYAQFEILGTYDSLYIRVFGVTDFSNGEVISSYWGLSGVQTGTNVIGTWYVPIIDNTVAANLNYFEVIPEPGTVSLLILGGVGLLAGRHRRRFFDPQGVEVVRLFSRNPFAPRAKTLYWS
jgi:hypothetical protein